MALKSFDMEKLTPHFARWEFTVSETATRRDIPNVPSLEEWDSLKALSASCLEPAREALGPLRITSGFRSSSLNAAVGGAVNSRHTFGEAADVIPMTVTLAKLFLWFHANAPYDQLIWEFGSWIHISHKQFGDQRKEALLAYRRNGRTVYAPISQEQLEAM